MHKKTIPHPLPSYCINELTNNIKQSSILATWIDNKFSSVNKSTYSISNPLVLSMSNSVWFFSVTLMYNLDRFNLCIWSFSVLFYLNLPWLGKSRIECSKILRQNLLTLQLPQYQPIKRIKVCKNRTIDYKLCTRIRSWTKCLKNQPCDVIKMREMRGEVGKKPLKKEMDNPSFLWRHMGDLIKVKNIGKCQIVSQGSITNVLWWF